MRDEKFELYDIAFKIGFIFTVLVFAVLNLINYFNSVAKEKHSIQFSNYLGPQWGFPFPMVNHSGYSGIEPFSFALNIAICLICGYVFGLILRFVWKKLRKTNNNLQG